MSDLLDRHVIARFAISLQFPVQNTSGISHVEHCLQGPTSNEISLSKQRGDDWNNDCSVSHAGDFHLARFELVNTEE